LTHNSQYGEEYYSFVNGQYTTQGGTHLAAFKEAIVKTVREFYKKQFEASDIRQAIVGAISVRVQEPVFESQTKTKLGSQNMWMDGPSDKIVLSMILSKINWIRFLHKNPGRCRSFAETYSTIRTRKKRFIRHSVSWPTNAQNLPTCTIKNYAIVRVHYSDEKNENARRKRPCL
jgi:topoisomerase-4 subunit B